MLLVDLESLYKKWVGWFSEERIILKFSSLKALYDWFLRETEIRGVDPDSVNFEAYVDPKLSYQENQRILSEVAIAGRERLEKKSKLLEEVKQLHKEVS